MTLSKKYPKLRAVKITYSDGTVINTSLAGHVSDSDIKKYFRIGKIFNVGNVRDKLVKVKKVKIIK